MSHSGLILIIIKVSFLHFVHQVQLLHGDVLLPFPQLPIVSFYLLYILLLLLRLLQQVLAPQFYVLSVAAVRGKQFYPAQRRLERQPLGVLEVKVFFLVERHMLCPARCHITKNALIIFFLKRLKLFKFFLHLF